MLKWNVNIENPGVETMKKDLDHLHLGPFGSNLIGEPLYYFKELDMATFYKTAILGITQYQGDSYVFTDLDFEYSDEADELGYRTIKSTVNFKKCMCGRVPKSLYNITPFMETEGIWGGF
jgi:hypothetical protein